MSAPLRNRTVEEILRLPRSEKVNHIEFDGLCEHFSAQSFRPLPGQDFVGPYGHLVLSGTVQDLRLDFDARVARLGSRQAAIDELAALSWYSNEQSVLITLLGFLRNNPRLRPALLAKLAFLISLPLPLDVPDLMGATAMHHALNKNMLDLEFAEMLYDAGADIHWEDRAGWTVVHRASPSWIDQDAKGALRALTWMSQKGGNFDCPAKAEDGRKVTPRTVMLASLHEMGPSLARQTLALLDEYDDRRAKLRGKACGFCLGVGQKSRKGNEESKCGRCYETIYCGKECQLKDWSHH